MNSFDCLIIGDVFIDIIVKVNGNYKQLPRGGISYCSYAETALGGGGNVAVGLSTIGGRSAFIGKAGQDFYRKLYADDLRENGVATKLFLDKHLPTGLTVVFVENDQRSFLISRGANDQLASEEIERAANLIERSEYIYFSGFSLVNNPQRDTILRTIDHAGKLGKKIVFDPGAFNLAKSEMRLFNSLLDMCEVFSPNLEEASVMTGMTKIEDIIGKLRERVPLTLLKCDKAGSVLISKAEVVKVPVNRGKCMDPTGAGDAFTAGAIYGLCRKMPLKSIGQLANWFSAEVVSQNGPRSFPKKSKIMHFLRKLKD
jgi:fructokinase